MKTFTHILGLVLILLGIVFLGYKNIHYQKPEEVLKLGDMRITATTEKEIDIPPIVAGACIFAGIALVAISRIGKK